MNLGYVKRALWRLPSYVLFLWKMSSNTMLLITFLLLELRRPLEADA